MSKQIHVEKQIVFQPHLKQGLLTLEAALVVPIFLFVLYFFLYFFQILMLQDMLHSNATKVAKEISSYGTLFNLLMKDTAGESDLTKNNQADKSSDISDDANEDWVSKAIGDFDITDISGKVIDSLYLSQKLQSYITDMTLVNRCIYGGYDGIQFYTSSVFDEEECVTITMIYQIQMPMFDQVFPTLPVIQTVRMRSFNGFAVAKKEGVDEEETSEEMVYMTKNGQVYHSNRNCTHLCISVRAIPSSQLSVSRNKNNEKYKTCEQCFQKGDPIPSTLYVTTYGDRYHKNSDCSSITRTVLTVPLSNVKDKQLCKRCAAYND